VEGETGLRRVGRLLRDLHDASAAYVPPVGAVWGVVVRPDREDLVVHHDAAPWNLVLGPQRWVLIDWDAAGPGSRLWDLSYAAHGFVPLTASTPPAVAGRRLAALAAGYGLDEPGRRELAALLHRRTLSMWALLQDGSRRGVQPWARLWDEGHGAYWRADAGYVQQHEQLLLAALLDGA
jgi:Ser/Thr protein kinase RdoA (MazF antagonist)